MDFNYFHKSGKFTSPRWYKGKSWTLTFFHKSKKFTSPRLHKGKSWTCNFFEDVQISKFGKFSKFFSKFQNNLAPKNRLVHPELRVCHFWKFQKMSKSQSLVHINNGSTMVTRNHRSVPVPSQVVAVSFMNLTLVLSSTLFEYISEMVPLGWGVPLILEFRKLLKSDLKFQSAQKISKIRSMQIHATLCCSCIAAHCFGAVKKNLIEITCDFAKILQLFINI